MSPVVVATPSMRSRKDRRGLPTEVYRSSACLTWTLNGLAASGLSHFRILACTVESVEVF